MIWTSYVISFWTGGQLTSVDRNNQKLKTIMVILWWISHLLCNYTITSAPNWQNSYIIGFLITNNIRFDTNIIILLCLEQNIRSDIQNVVGWPPSWILKKAKPMASSHPGQISSTHQELMKNVNKWLLPEIAHFTPNMGFCLRTTKHHYGNWAREYRKPSLGVHRSGCVWLLCSEEADTIEYNYKIKVYFLSHGIVPWAT